MISTLGCSLERFLLPNVCIVCERSVSQNEPDALVCGVCITRMRPVGSGCDRCAQPLPPMGGCRFCVDWPDRFRARSGVWLGREARVVVHALKYRHMPRLAELAARVLTRTVPVPAGPCVLIPVPVGKKRLRRRGYNQAERLARALARRWRKPVMLDALQRVRDTTSQTALTPERRLANVAGAFEGRQVGLLERSPGKVTRAVLIDDVLTTGATLQGAAEMLIKSNWQSVDAVTFARALPYDLSVLGH